MFYFLCGFFTGRVEAESIPVVSIAIEVSIGAAIIEEESAGATCMLEESLLSELLVLLEQAVNKTDKNRTKQIAVIDEMNFLLSMLFNLDCNDTE